MTLNKSMLIGRLVKDPNLVVTPSGVSICKFTLAVERGYKDAQGNKQSDFIQCLAFKKTAENLANHMKKGSRILVEGNIQTGSYEHAEKGTIYITEVVAQNIQFLEYRQQQPGQPQPQNSAPVEVNEDSLPF